MASGDTKTEAMLNALGNGGSADEFRGCCNTKTQQYILDAIDRVQNVEDEVEELKNNPDVVDIVDTYADLQAYDTTHLSDNDIIRVLADETHSGNSTYYKFNKQAGTWTFIGEIAGGGGGVTELTSADYNYPTDSPTSVAAWLLDDGIYSTKSAGVMFDAYSAPVYSTSFMVATDSSNMKYAIIFNNSEGGYIRQTGVSATNANRILTDKNLKQATGTSQTDVMSQNAVTSMVFADPSTMNNVKIGVNTFTPVGANSVEIGRESKAKGNGTIAIGSSATADSFAGSGVVIGANATIFGENTVAIGYLASTNNEKAVALGRGANAGHSFSVALGAGSTTSAQGEINVGTGSSYTTKGYNNSNYRLLSGLYDGQNAHDAATVGQVNSVIDAINTALSTNIPHIGA